MSASRLEEKQDDKTLCASSKSMESLYSLSSANSKSTMHHRKSLSIQSANASSLSKSSEVRQRVISARILRFKNVQNQLTDALQHISALSNENRLLKTLQKRQDSALTKYVGTNAELPQLLHSHAEELRVWHTKYRALSVKNRDLTMQSKQKDEVILRLTERNRHLTQLNDDKNLEVRETLSGKVHYLELRMAEKDEEINTLMRRIHLETKNFKAQLCNEQKKYKMLCQKLGNVTTRVHVPITTNSGDETYKIKTKSTNSLLPRMIQRTTTSDEEDGTAMRYGQKPNDDMLATKMCESHSCSDDDNDDHIGGGQANNCGNNHSCFPPQEYSEDEDLIVKEIESDETIGSPPLVEHFNGLSLEGDGNGCVNMSLNCIEENDDDKLDEKCCNDEANDDEDESAGNETNRTHGSGIAGRPLHRQIPRRLPMDPKKKNQLLAALKSIDSNKRINQD